jgi:hypothetical protein
MEEEAGTTTIPRPQREGAIDKISIVPKRAPLIRKALDKSSAMGTIKPPSKHGGAPKKTLTPKEAATWKKK